MPGTDIVRPTSDRVKEAVFSSVQFDVEGRRVLDLFAGSGQLGIEALSRGAEKAVFVDRCAECTDVVKKNLEITGLKDKAVVFCGDYSSFLSRNSETFDIAFLDPPYSSGILVEALGLVTNHMSDYGIIFCEHPSDLSLPEAIGCFKAVRTYRFGSISVTTYKKGVSQYE